MAPFYPDKMNLMAYRDEAGEHPVRAPEDWALRREHILENMQLVMGPLPGPERKVPLSVEIVWEEELPTVTRRKITYASEAGHRVPAYVCIPAVQDEPAPAVLCLHGTSGGRGRIAGIGEEYAPYALEPAERGYVTISPDYPLLADNEPDLEALGYASGAMKGIWDHMRAIDVLLGMPEVDGERIAAMGLSLGGHNALFVAAFDPRVRAAVTSSGFDSFADYMGGDIAGWCQDRYMMRLETVYDRDPARVPFDFPEVLGVIAPRPVFVHAPLSDSNFRVDSVRRCVAAAMPVYELFGAADNLVAIYPEGEHGFPPEARESAYQFLDEVL